jgi:hypothetical protein
MTERWYLAEVLGSAGLAVPRARFKAAYARPSGEHPFLEVKPT